MFQCFNKFQMMMQHVKTIALHIKKKLCQVFQIKILCTMKLQQIIATLQRSGHVSKFRKFLFIIDIPMKHHQKVFGSSGRGRVHKHVGLLNYTTTVPGALIGFSFVACHLTLEEYK